VLAVQVSALGDDTAALWLRLTARLADGTTAELGTAHPGWRTTTNAAITGSALGAPPAFLQAAFGVAGWSQPQRIAAVHAVRVPVPEVVSAAPTLPADVTTVTGPTTDGVFRLALSAPSGVEDSWVRVVANGRLTVSLGGKPLLVIPAPSYVSPNSHRPTILWQVHLGNRLHGGTNQFTFRVSSPTQATLAVDSFVRVGNRTWVPLGDDRQRWSLAAVTGDQALTQAPSTVAARTWPNGFLATPATELPSTMPWKAPLLGALAMLALALSLILIATVRSAALGLNPTMAGRAALGRLLLVLAPAVAVIGGAVIVGRWVTSTPGLAYRPGIALAALAALLVVPLCAGIGALTATVGRRTGPWRAGPWRAGPWRPLRWLSPARAAIIAITVLSTTASGWRLGRQPVWQDEATSVAVARAIRAHGLPKLDSGLYYFKAELYHALLAGLLSFTDSTTALRALSLAWFAATLLAFGFVLMPTLTSSAAVIVGATAFIAALPTELVWARDIRMYQQMQFFAVLFVAYYLRALTHGRRRDITISAVMMLAMYLSHEESFVLLPAVPLVALVAGRTVWAHRKGFLVAYVPAFVVIAVQYAVSHLHPVDFGTDLSNRPYVGWDPHSADFYYQRIFFAPLTQASLAIVSSVAIVGMVLAFRRRQQAARLLSIVLLTSVVSMSLLFTAKVDRYSFVTMPMLVALAALGTAQLYGWVVGLASGTTVDATDQHARRSPRWLTISAGLAVLLFSAAALASVANGPRSFGVWAADVTATPNPLSHSDYQTTVNYLQQNVRPGDQVVTLSPPVMTQLYLGRAPDRIIQTGRNKLLYLVLRNGTAVDTLVGRPVLLTGPALRIYLEQHSRVWLVSDSGSYLQGVPPDLQSVVTSSFRIMEANATTTVSLWSTG
jgi:hypothetical protein